MGGGGRLEGWRWEARGWGGRLGGGWEARGVEVGGSLLSPLDVFFLPWSQQNQHCSM